MNSKSILIGASVMVSSVLSTCFDAERNRIEGCVCDESCATCGYQSNPVHDVDCINCADGSDVKLRLSDTTGLCGKEKSAHVACLDEKVALSLCMQQRGSECSECDFTHTISSEDEIMCDDFRSQACSYKACCPSCGEKAAAYIACVADPPVLVNGFVLAPQFNSSACVFEECLRESGAGQVVLVGGIIVAVISVLLGVALVVWRICSHSNKEPSDSHRGSHKTSTWAAMFWKPAARRCLETQHTAESQEGFRVFKDQTHTVMDGALHDDIYSDMNLPPFAMVDPVLPSIAENSELTPAEVGEFDACNPGHAFRAFRPNRPFHMRPTGRIPKMSVAL